MKLTTKLHQIKTSFLVFLTKIHGTGDGGSDSTIIRAADAVREHSQAFPRHGCRPPGRRAARRPRGFAKPSGSARVRGSRVSTAVGCSASWQVPLQVAPNFLHVLCARSAGRPVLRPPRPWPGPRGPATQGRPYHLAVHREPGEAAWSRPLRFWVGRCRCCPRPPPRAPAVPETRAFLTSVSSRCWSPVSFLLECQGTRKL